MRRRLRRLGGLNTILDILKLGFRSLDSVEVYVRKPVFDVAEIPGLDSEAWILLRWMLRTRRPAWGGSTEATLQTNWQVSKREDAMQLKRYSLKQDFIPLRLLPSGYAKFWPITRDFVWPLWTWKIQILLPCPQVHTREVLLCFFSLPLQRQSRHCQTCIF